MAVETICKMIFKANYFAADKGKSLTGSAFIKAEMILSCVYVELHVIYFQMIFNTILFKKSLLI